MAFTATINGVQLTEEQVDAAMKQIAQAKEKAARYIPEPGDFFQFRSTYSNQVGREIYMAISLGVNAIPAKHISENNFFAVSWRGQVGWFNTDDHFIQFIKLNRKSFL